MTELKCEVCGAELVPATAFCRKCGAAVTPSGGLHLSEQPTKIFPHEEGATTQRLNARSTQPTVSSLRPPASRKRLIAVLIVLAVALGIAIAVATKSHRTETTAATDDAVLYPGATTVVDMKNTDGSRTVQLQTGDSLSRVESWYHNNHKLQKTIRLTSNSVVLKGQKTTITLAVENNKTNILIKQAP